MNDLFSNKQTGYLVISALIAVLLGAIYYFLVYPMSEEKNSKEVTISTVRSEIALLDSQLTSPVEEDEDKNSFQLEKKVPLTRELDMLIKSIEEIDLVSEAKIESIEFNNYDEIVADSTLVPSEEEAASPETNDATTEETEGEQPAETPVSPVANSTLPPQLKLITFNINILTKDYDHLNTFIKELESIERIKRIDQIEFLMPGEESLLDLDFKDAISARIQVTTFYYDE
ncbi:potassium transporter [Psychrobacillus psychrotolerans]|uniref:potassium transporter n=1 Tax=Psychrobacillus psychrotolerans TaxID=126156 RepID=UPI003B023F83